MKLVEIKIIYDYFFDFYIVRILEIIIEKDLK